MEKVEPSHRRFLMIFLRRRLAAITVIATGLATQYDALILLRARVKHAEGVRSARRRMRRSDRAERDHHHRKRPDDGSYETRRFSALSLPRFAMMSNDTLAPSRRSLRPALSTAEICTNTSLPLPPSG